MPKEKVITNPLEIKLPDGLIRKKSQIVRAQVKQHYVEYFFNKWMNKFTFDKLEYQQIRYMMKRFWMESAGNCAFYVLPMSQTEKAPEGKLIITPFAPAGKFNIYDYPIDCTLINTRGVKFIPTKILEIDKDVVIGYITRTHKGVYSLISAKIDELVEIDMAIRGNLKALKTPWMVGVTPENEKLVKKFIQNLDDDDPYLFIPLDDLANAKALLSGAPMYIDKFEVKRQQVKDEINTILGFNSVGIMNKKEHLTTGEVNMNSEDTNASNDIFYDCLVEMFARVEEVLHYKVTPHLNAPVATPMPEDEDENEEDEEYARD